MCTMLQVSLVSIPSREELRQKNLFSVSDCKMYWQSNGDYLAVKVCFGAAVQLLLGLVSSYIVFEYPETKCALAS